ncbi:uncharacterized [Tachysurus ichikawai]
MAKLCLGTSQPILLPARETRLKQGTMTLFSLFFRLSSDCTIHINYSEAVSGFPRQSQSQMELCANGLLLYLPPAPSCSETLGHRESG